MRILALAFALGLTGCGYHVAGTADTLPKTIGTIAVPAFGNVTTQYKVSDLLATAVTRELISRTRYHVNADPDTADAVLSGAVVNFISYPTIFDNNAGRATGVQAIVILSVTLRDKAGNVLFSRPNFEVHERYEISIDPRNYFDESEPAMQRLSRDVARSVVSAILEKF
ncbi:MAG: LPS assembly lipoprotein LptE [Acidobacteriota bacterium]|nr:LPS assembly lipoprotein LptE [Acidobacteriota bacterium]